MALAYRIDDLSVGHDGYPPTACTTGASKTWWEGHLAAFDGSEHAAHSKPNAPIHPASSRTISAGSVKTWVEGNLAARAGDPIDDGDTCGAGASKTYIE
jgi:uncharacterized Zn-binding protein involved in type VI secretion